MDPKARFSNRVEKYVRYRPSYPPALISRLQVECELTPASRIADIGSGTRLLTRLLLEAGCFVYGIEPNDEMRTAAERFLAAYPRFHSLNAAAEATTLPDIGQF